MSTVPQTGKDYKIEFSTDGGTTWEDYSGLANSVAPGGGARETKEYYGLNDDSPTVLPGARKKIEVKMKIAYNESATEPFTLWQWYEAGQDVMCKLTPAGGSKTFTSDIGHITECLPPGHEGGSSDPLLMEITFEAGKWTAA